MSINLQTDTSDMVYPDIHTAEYYFTIKRREVDATTWINLENIMLSEMSQSQEETLIQHTA